MEEYQSERYSAFISERLEALRSLIGEACARAGRDPREVELLAVSKTVGPDEVRLAMAAGQRVFGENRPQELKRKLTALRDSGGLDGIRFDMIGNLQKNKINQVLGSAELIHSASSLHLAQAIAKRAEARGILARVLLEVNVSGEESKSGFSPDEVRSQIEDVISLGGIKVEGLMTMAPAHDASESRRTFSGLRDLVDELRTRTGLPFGVLSCGMCDDFQIAVEEGSTLVRLGRIVFDERYRLD
ncbi:MAG: YggS family pyridoxal phosphate-dependent enzyme [Atopobiaceae bacterium]|nr:YggS family pyridoxal phosphate-dependent enzyme [Atopobiaceae bacterium]